MRERNSLDSINDYNIARMSEMFNFESKKSEFLPLDAEQIQFQSLSAAAQPLILGDLNSVSRLIYQLQLKSVSSTPKNKDGLETLLGDSYRISCGLSVTGSLKQVSCFNFLWVASFLSKLQRLRAND